MARIEESKRTYIEELATNPRVNLMVLSERIDIVFHEDESEVSLAEKIAEKLYDMPQLITKLLQQEAIEFLLQCWDMEGESLIAEMYAREIEQLHFLGFLSSVKWNNQGFLHSVLFNMVLHKYSPSLSQCHIKCHHYTETYGKENRADV